MFTSFKPGDKCLLIDDDLFAEATLCHEPDFWSQVDPWEAVGLDEITIGLMAFEMRDYKAAASALMCVGEEDVARYALAQEWLGTTHLRTGHPDQAIEPLRRAVMLAQQRGRDPLTVAECQFSLGLAFARSGHDECALREFRAALHCEPDWGTVLFEIARVHAHRNRIGECVAAIAEAAHCDEFFLSRALHDFDFDTVRQSPEFTHMTAECSPAD